MCSLQALLGRVSISDHAAQSIWQNSFPFMVSFRSKNVDFAARNSSYKSTITLISCSNCCLQCHLSQISLSAASSKSSWSTCREFWHAMPLHWRHAGVHCRPFLKQVQDRVSHLPPQLHLMFHRSCTGVSGSDICTGTRPVDYLVHLHSSGERLFPFHGCTCRKTRWPWNRAEIRRGLMSAEASLVVRIQLLWPLLFETFGALQFSDDLFGFHTW